MSTPQPAGEQEVAYSHKWCGCRLQRNLTGMCDTSNLSSAPSSDWNQARAPWPHVLQFLRQCNEGREIWGRGMATVGSSGGSNLWKKFQGKITASWYDPLLTGQLYGNCPPLPLASWVPAARDTSGSHLPLATCASQPLQHTTHIESSMNTCPRTSWIRWGCSFYLLFQQGSVCCHPAL